MAGFKKRYPDSEFTTLKPGDLVVPSKPGTEWYQRASIFLGIGWERRECNRGRDDNEIIWIAYPYFLMASGDVKGMDFHYLNCCKLLCSGPEQMKSPVVAKVLSTWQWLMRWVRQRFMGENPWEVPSCFHHE